MPTPWTVIVTLSVIVSIVVVVLVLVAPPADVRLLRKPLWIVVALVPIVGAVLWLVFGKPLRPVAGKRVAKEKRRPSSKRQKINADRQVVVDRLTSDIRTRPPRISGSSAGSPGSPGSLTARAARSAQSAQEQSAVSPATATYSDE